MTSPLRELQNRLGCQCAPDDGDWDCPVHGLDAPVTVGTDSVRRFADGTVDEYGPVHGAPECAADVLDRLEAAGDGWGQREAARQERAFQRRLYLNWDRLVEGHADALEAGSAGVAAAFLDAAVKARMACIAAQESNPLRRHNYMRPPRRSTQC